MANTLKPGAVRDSLARAIVSAKTSLASACASGTASPATEDRDPKPPEKAVHVFETDLRFYVEGFPASTRPISPWLCPAFQSRHPAIRVLCPERAQRRPLKVGQFPPRDPELEEKMDKTGRSIPQLSHRIEKNKGQ